MLLAGYLLPEQMIIPVQDATTADWNEDTFWYEPWGASGVHKGIDIFAPKGQPALAAVGGVVVYSGQLRIGGEVVAVLGPKWRIHYYAHLDDRNVETGSLLGRGDKIGTVGNSGNAAGKPSHLHYSILSPIPYPWRFSARTQGWKKMFYLNPDRKLRADAVP